MALQIACPTCGKSDALSGRPRGQAVGLTLSELGEVLAIRDRGEPPCRHVAELIDARMREIDEHMSDLRKLRKDLAGLAATAAELDPEECTKDNICKILEPSN